MKKTILNKIITIAIWSFFIAVLAISLGFSDSQFNKVKCIAIEVNIIDSTGFSFVEPKDIKELLIEKGYKIIGNNLEE